jgi:hypothetical protein
MTTPAGLRAVCAQGGLATHALGGKMVAIRLFNGPLLSNHDFRGFHRDEHGIAHLQAHAFD